jgi:chromosome segregation ATPase
MNPREKLEATLAQARADRDKAGAERAKLGTDWRKQEAAGVSYDQYRARWAELDTAWNKANALVEKLEADLAALQRAEEKSRKRADLEATLAAAIANLDKANKAFVAATKARAEGNAAPVPARAERRGNAVDRRKPGFDRRKAQGDRRSAKSAAAPDARASAWAEIVNSYNKADAAVNRARAALAELDRAERKR